MSTLKENAKKQIPINLMIISSLFLINILIRPNAGSTRFHVIIALVSSIIAIVRLYILEKELRQLKDKTLNQ